jgi:hypothetical protein
VPALERPHGTHRLRPLNGVDRPSVETVLTQRDLEARDLRVVRLSGGRERKSGQSGRDREGRTAHLPKVGGRALVSSFQVVKNRVGLGVEGERHRLADGELAALLPRLGDGGVIELGADGAERCFVHLRDP